MKPETKEKWRQGLADGLVIIAASLLFSASVNMFIEPARLIMGGVTGIATAANLLSDGLLPIGMTALALNIPLLIAVWVVYGFRFIGKTLVCTVATSLATDYFKLWPTLRIAENDAMFALLAAIFGGILMGAALGMLFARGYNTGGTDLLVFLIRRKHKRLSAGTIVFITDCLIVLGSAIANKSLEMIFFSAITIYVQSKTIDFVVSGFHRARSVFIISEKEAEIAAALAEKLERGVTLLNGRGYYSGNERQVILCAIPPKQVHQLKSLVEEIDPDAFLIIGEASEVAGYGFEKRGM